MEKGLILMKEYLDDLELSFFAEYIRGDKWLIHKFEDSDNPYVIIEDILDLMGLAPIDFETDSDDKKQLVRELTWYIDEYVCERFGLTFVLFEN